MTAGGRDWTKPIGDRCPMCEQPAPIILGGGTQAFCFTDDCPVMTWNPLKTLAQLNAEAREIKITERRRPDEATE